MNSIRDILKIKTQEDLELVLEKIDQDYEREFDPLERALRMDILGTDVPSNMQHASYVEKYRGRLVRCNSLVTALAEYSKSSLFSLAKDKGITEFDRDAYKRKLSFGFLALQYRLEGLIDCLDSRVNLCKKMIDNEGRKFEERRVA